MHTPGPWHDNRCIKAIVPRGPDAGFVIARYPTRTHRSKVTHEEWEANARLIAAAPDLLAGLIQATDQLEADYVATPLDGMSALIRKLRAIIAKAEAP